MTVAELEQWAIRHTWGARRHAEMLRLLRSRFAVIDSSRPLCRKWAEVREEVRGSGRVIQPSDALVAATALLYDVPLLTHNSADFAGVQELTVITETGH